MNTRYLVSTFSSVVLLAQSAPTLAAEELPRTPPNILVIYADDLGYGDVSCYNPERGKIATPHIDRLASEGMRFTDGHSSSAVCTPSRYTLLTGRYHWRSRLQDGICGIWENPLIPPDRMTIGGLAKKHGYHTGFIGKWHLGWEWGIPDDQLHLFITQGHGQNNAGLTTNEEHRKAWREVFSRPIPGGPVALGFDTYFGVDVPNWPPFCFIENARTVGIPSEFGAPGLFGKNLASKQWPAVEGWKLERILPTLTDRVIDFISQHAKAPKPFLLSFSLTSPHTPLSVNDEWKGKSGLNLYADLVMETDAAVGQVLAALEKSGVHKNTLVVLTSDNGCAPYVGVDDMEGKGHFPSGPLRGYKSDAWEGGHRVPFMVRWPGVAAPGSVSNQLVHQADLMATFAAIMGAKLPENAGEDSFSLLSLLEGTEEALRQHAVSTSVQGVPALRLGSWKYIPAPGSGGWSEGAEPGRSIQLYNLADDPGETNNLAAHEAERVAQMRKMLEDLIIQGRSTPGPRQKNDVAVHRYPESSDGSGRQ